jgi:hypothetical protein
MAKTGRIQEWDLERRPRIRRNIDQTPIKKIVMRRMICHVGTAPLQRYNQFRPYGALNQKFCKTMATKNH